MESGIQDSLGLPYTGRGIILLSNTINVYCNTLHVWHIIVAQTLTVKDTFNGMTHSLRVRMIELGLVTESLGSQNYSELIS